MPTHPKLKMGGVCLLSLLAAQAALAGPLELHRLEVSKLERLSFLINYSSHTTHKAPKPGDTFKFKYEDTQRRKNSSDYIEVGATFFGQGAMKDRFCLQKVRSAEVAGPRGGAPQIEYVATIEDQKPNKFGTVYEVTKGSGSKGVIIRDYTATLSHRGPAGAQLLRVEENESFSIPFNKKGAKPRYTFRGVNKNGDVVIEYKVKEEVRKHTLKAPEK